MKRITLYLREDLVRQIRIESAKRDISFQDWCRGALTELSIRRNLGGIRQKISAFEKLKTSK
jgi:hypothetical protein